jgi:hypothetical protein
MAYIGTKPANSPLTSELIPDGLIATSDIADGAITAAKITNSTITSAKLASGQTLSVNGITFPATQVASADANTLDDYEEGTWTPTIAGFSTAGSYTYSLRSGAYTKTGRIVTAQFTLTGITTVSAGSGCLTITGLPFTASNSEATLRAMNAVPRARLFSTTRNNIIAIVGEGTTTVFIGYDNSGAGGGTDYPVTDISSGSSQIGCTVIYQVA